MNEKKISAISLIAAVVAVVLSQFRPLYTYLDKPKLTSTVAPMLQIYHQWGFISVTPFLQFKNSGNASGTISRIELLLEKKDDPRFHLRLQALSYFLKPSTVSTGQIVTSVPFADIQLGPGETWEAYVTLGLIPPKAEQVKIADFKLQIYQQIQATLAKRPFTPFDSAPKKIDERLFGRVRGLVDRNMSGFGVGEYNLLLVFEDDLSKVLFITKCYNISVYEADMKFLSEITNQYKMGAGVYFPSQSQLAQGFYTPLIEISDETVKSKMQENFKHF